MLIRLMKVLQLTPLKMVDTIVTQREITWNGQAPFVIECGGEHYTFAYSIHEEGPDNTKELWHCYRPTTFIDVTGAPIIAWSTPDDE